jgi:hypothetical protein
MKKKVGVKKSPTPENLKKLGGKYCLPSNLKIKKRWTGIPAFS